LDELLLQRLSDRLDATILESLGGATDVAMVNFPNHGNPGDSALWLGAKASLRRLGVRVRYQCAWDTYSPGALLRRLPHGPVLINGGGNLGDLYGGQQGLRERLFRELRGRPIVQLPQSMHFQDRANLDRNRRLVADHGAVTLIARERESEARFRESFDTPVLLAPDCAFGLRRLRTPADPAIADILWLRRKAGDAEYVDHGGPPPDISLVDVEWLEQQQQEPQWLLRHRAARTANEWLRPRAARDTRWARHAWRPLSWTLDPLGWGFTFRGMDILGRGKFLVTDKLHGHIMATLAGLPHVVMDNSYGKVSATYRSWTHESELSIWADDGEQARAIISSRLAAS
jgi:exopolysaccharide biosynthesis predicted pyruvyltransferase EpsI